MRSLTIAFAIFASAFFLSFPVSANGSSNGHNNGNGHQSAPTESSSDSTAVGVGVGIAGSSSNADVTIDNDAYSTQSLHSHNSSRVSNFNEGATSDASNDVDASSDTTVNVDSDHGGSAASSAAAIVIGACSKGVSAQTHMGGGAMASPDEVCLLFSLSSMYRLNGDIEKSDKALEDAASILRFRANPVRKGFQAIPLIGNIF